MALKRKGSAGASTNRSNASHGPKRLCTPESLVQQKIRDNFKDFGPEETDVRKSPCGKTLRETLLADYLASKANPKHVAFGKSTTTSCA